MPTVQRAKPRRCPGPESLTARRLRRTLQFLFIVKGSPEAVTARDLARMMKVSRRTVYRDLKLLRDAGVAIDYCPSDKCLRIHGGSSACIDAALWGWLFGWEETVAVFATLLGARISPDTDLHEACQRARAQLKAHLQSCAPGFLESVEQAALLLRINPFRDFRKLASGREVSCDKRAGQGVVDVLIGPRYPERAVARAQVAATGRRLHRLKPAAITA